MRKIDKHIEKLEFVKVYITDNEEQILTHFEGVIFNQNEDFIYMCDLSDFNYDGFVIVRKTDVAEIKRSDNEKFFNRILKEEKIIRNIRLRKREIGFRVGEMEEMFAQLRKKNFPVIVECLYGSEDSFQIGPIVQVKENKMKMDYFNSLGEFDEQPVSIKYKDITFVRIDSPYANLFYKYATRPGEEVEKKKSKSKKKKSEKTASKKDKKKSKKDKKSKKKSKKLMKVV